MQSSILGVVVCGCVSDAGVGSSNVHAAPVYLGVERCVCESHVVFISIASVKCVLHFILLMQGGSDPKSTLPISVGAPLYPNTPKMNHVQPIKKFKKQ